jgi:hypothetical protein
MVGTPLVRGTEPLVAMDTPHGGAENGGDAAASRTPASRGVASEAAGRRPPSLPRVWNGPGEMAVRVAALARVPADMSLTYL